MKRLAATLFRISRTTRRGGPGFRLRADAAASCALLALFSFSLLAPLVFADSDSRLPACCRKNGKHHCSMMQADDGSTGPGIKSVQTKCPLFPAGSVVSPGDAASGPGVALVFFADIVSHPAAHAQTEARRRVAFSRAWYKRGPPSLLS